MVKNRCDRGPGSCNSIVLARFPRYAVPATGTAGILRLLREPKLGFIVLRRQPITSTGRSRTSTTVKKNSGSTASTSNLTFATRPNPPHHPEPVPGIPSPPFRFLRVSATQTHTHPHNPPQCRSLAGTQLNAALVSSAQPSRSGPLRLPLRGDTTRPRSTPRLPALWTRSAN